GYLTGCRRPVCHNIPPSYTVCALRFGSKPHTLGLAEFMSSYSRTPGAEPTTLAYMVVLAGVTTSLHIWKLPPALPTLGAELDLSLVESGFLLSLVQLGGMTLGLLTGLFA